VQHEEEARQLLSSRDLIIDTLTTSLHSLSEQLAAQQTQFEAKLRSAQEESGRQISELQAAMQASEEQRVQFQAEKDALGLEKESLRAQVEKMETVQEMQAAEIDRLSLEAGKTSQMIEGGMTVSKDSMIKLTHKVD